MKKIKYLIFSLLVVGLLSGCSFNKNTLDNAKIYTTVYPVEYIINYLYGENSTIESIYPTDVNLDEYTLTDKQIEKYAKGDLFTYIGLGKEKEIAKSLLNKNKNLLIIDATYGLNYNEGIEELWLAPNNFLMLAKNIKNSLNEYLDNSFKSDDINKLYDELYEKVSWVDAELRSVAKTAEENENNTIVIENNTLKFLENYGFNIISLEDISASGSENAINDIKSKFKNSKYTKVLKLSGTSNSELLNDLQTKYNAEVAELNNIITNSDTASDYISIQYENIAIIRDLLNI